jgi:CheY-like chemotaxis protein
VSALSKTNQSLRVFVVEDHADTLKYLCMYLETAGHIVFQARSLAAALDAIPKADCDVLISDVALPDGDGWQLLTQLKEAHLPHPPYAIIMSGFGTLGDRAKSAAAGYRQHMLKPFNPRDLASLLKEAAEEARLRQGKPTI